MKDQRAAQRSEAGMTLAEVLVAVAILGIAVIAIVNGIGTVSMSSDRHRKQATADTVLKSYAENVKEKAKLGAYVSCGSSPAPSTASYASLPGTPTVAGYSSSVTSLQFLNSAGGFQASCPSPDQGAQLLTLSVQSTDGRDTESVQMVLRRP
jgi:prepilin-type N-terminal cleavage/methylation domain-containing protein